MNYFDLNLHAIFGWLVRSSLHVSVLVCLIIAVKAVVGKRLAVRWHWWLWMVLVVRMVMPWAPESKVSVYNLLPEFEAANTTLDVQGTTEAAVTDEPAGTATSISTDISPLPASEQIDTETEPTVMAAESFAIADVLPILWLGGVLVLGVYVVGSNLRLWRIVKRVRPLTDGAVLDLLEDCKEQMGVQTMLGVVVTDEVEGPALFGFVRPRLLLPSGLVERLSEGQLRHVFLHELAHLRRYDIYFGWLMAGLQVMHWFNPLVWFAFHKMRADRELACDGLALAVMGADEPAAYGQTIVSMLERFSQRQYVPGMAGILEDKGQLKRRITMIAKFKKGSYRWSALAAVLLVVLGVVSLTNAQNRPSAEHKKELAEGFVKLLVEEKFDEAVEEFDSTMKKALPAGRLGEVWKGTVGQVGSFKGQLGVRAQKWLWSDIIYVSCDFEKGPLDIKVVYDSKSKVSGLWFVPVPEGVLAGYAGQSKSKETQLSFGPVIKRVIYSSEVGKEFFFDIDNNKVFAPPSSLTRSSPPEEVLEWSFKNGIDFVNDRGRFDITPQTVVVKVRNDFWEASFKEALNAFQAGYPEKDLRHSLDKEPIWPITYIFQTREGGFGLLQILGRNNDNLKIRYKMTQKPDVGGEVEKSAVTVAKPQKPWWDISAKKSRTRRSAASRSEFKAALPNGVTVELMGICKYDNQEISWKPDGRRFVSDLRVDTKSSIAGQERPAFFFKLNTDDFNLKFNCDGSDSSSGTDAKNTFGEQLKDHWVAIPDIDKSVERTNLRIGIATGQWQTIAEFDGDRKTSGPQDVVFSSLIETKTGGTAISVRGEFGFDGVRRIVAIDKNGELHNGGWDGRSSYDHTISIGEFDRITPGQIEKYQVRYRPYKFVKIKNVSLKPNFKTDVEVEVERAAKLHTRSLTPTASPARSMTSAQKRAEAARDAAMARAKANSQKSEKVQEAYNMMGPLDGMLYTSRDKLQGNDDIKSVLAVMEIALPRVEKFTGMLKDTDLAEAADIVKVQLQEVVSAMKDGDLDNAKIFLDSAYAGWSNLYHSMQKKATESKPTTSRIPTRTATPRSAQARRDEAAAAAAARAPAARAIANSQKSEKLQESAYMMGPLDGMLYTSRDKLQGDDDIKSVLAVMEVALPRVEKLTGLLEGTDFGEASDIVKVQIQEAVSAMKSGDLDNAKIFMDSAYASWGNLYHSIQKKATESKRSTSRTTARSAAQARAGAAREAAIARRKRAGVVEDREVSDREYRVRHFVRIVAGEDDEITFQGKKTTLEELADLLGQVPDRDITVLEVGFAEMPRRTKEIKNHMQWLSENPVWRKASELRKEFGFEYLSFVGKHKLGTVSGGTRNYLVRAMKFGEEIVVNLPSAEETPLIYLRTIEFRKNKAFLRGGVTSYPKTKWDIEIAFFDENMKRLDYVFKNYENSHIGKGVAAYVRETIEVDISKIKGLEKAKFFELSIKQAEERR